MPFTSQSLPTYSDVIGAAACLEGHAHRTPVLSSSWLDAQYGARFFFKAENFQRMGAFKFRGAYNALARFSVRQRKAGVLAYSSGNHAQAIALAARQLKIPAVIVMPEDAPAAKLAATRDYGAEVITYNRYTADREALAHQIANARGMSLVPPYDHPDVIAGQGTAVKELIEDVGPMDLLLVPLGGGGLLAGSALAARVLSPSAEIFGVEPQAGNDGQLSLQRGEIVHINTPKTLADGAQTQHLGQLTFAIIRRDVTGVLTASDEQLTQCMRFFAERMKIVVEPTGALGLAAALHAGLPLQGKRVGIVISGGNIDMARLAQLAADAPPLPAR